MSDAPLAGGRDDSAAPSPQPADPMDAFLDRITGRLRVDPELQLEIRRELRSHVDDSIAEYKRAGRSDADARWEAARALGDERELAEQLWRANRRRIRLRAAAMWAARLLLPPAAIALMVLLAYNAAVSWALSYHSLGHFQFWIVPPNSQGLAKGYRDAAIAAAPADIRPLFELNEASRERLLAVARELLQSHPDDPALYANYAATELERTPYRDDKPGGVIDEPVVARLLATLAEGERREPDNALYPLLSAAMLFDLSAREQEDESLTVHRPGHGPKDFDSWSRVQVLDPKRYALALDAVHRAAAKPYLRTYTGELLRRKLAVLPVRRLADVWLRVDEELRMLTTTLYYVHTPASQAALAATEAAAKGRRDEVERLLRDVRLIATAAAGDAVQPIEMHVACSDLRMADQAEARARAALGDAAGADLAWKNYDRRRADVRRAFNAHVSPDEKARAGILYANLLATYTRGDGKIDPAPMRRAEYLAADQLGVAAASAVVLILAALYAGSALFTWLRTWFTWRTSHRKRSGRLRLSIGWRRSLRIVAIAAVVPLLIYLGYARLPLLNGREYGLNVQMRRFVLEYGALAVIVMLLLISLTGRAIRARAAALGLELPKSGWRTRPTWRSLLAAAAIVSAFTCLVGAFAVIVGYGAARKSAPGIAIVFLAGCWGMIAAAAVALRNRKTPRDQDRRLFFAGVIARSAFPTIALAAVVLALAGLPLRWAESRQVAQAIQRQKSTLFLNEAEATEYVALREKLMDERQALLREQPEQLR